MKKLLAMLMCFAVLAVGTAAALAEEGRRHQTDRKRQRRRAG